MRLLIVNPNTSEATNQRLRHTAQLLLDEEDELLVMSAASGVHIIETPEQSAVTAPHVVSLIKTVSDNFDAVIIAAFSDPGLQNARDIAACPVLGISEAAMHQATKHGRFAIVTLGAALGQAIARNAEVYGYSEMLADILILPWTVTEVSSDIDKYRAAFSDACHSLVDEKNVSALIIGGGPLSGIADAIASELPVPVIDGVQSAVLLAKSTFSRVKHEASEN
ncbi:MAG: aspartate/glutamate racemase family protein [Alphaproteobacteria bacterium]